MASTQYYGKFVVFALISFSIRSQGEFTVKLSGEDETVLGGTIHLTAELYDDDSPAEGKFIFSWVDSGLPPYSQEIETELPTSSWNLTYDLPSRAPGPYLIQVTVSKKGWLKYSVVSSRRHNVNVNLYLSGQMTATQKDKIRDTAVATNSPINYTISLSPADLSYIHQSKNQLRTFWFVDCMYFGPSDNLSLSLTHKHPNKTHHMEALVVASYVPPTPTTTTTTTTTSTSTTTTTTTSTTTTTTPMPPHNTTNITPATLLNTTAEPPDPWLDFFSSFVAYNESLPSLEESGFCINMSSIPTSINDTYGYFNKKIVTKDEVRVVVVNGSNWLQEGAVLNMSVVVNGSLPLSYCMPLLPGIYNATGNETCDLTTPVPPSLTVNLNHFFIVPRQWTYLLILENEVSRLVTPIGVNIYQVKKQPQISVIVVPVVFSIAAVILIVFGVAWYVHTRRTFPVEVADFDFGQHSNDMEYKTFRERLRDSVMASFFRAEDSEDAQEEGWSPNRKYGSMQ